VAGRDLARRAVPETPSFLAPLDHPVFVRSAFQRLRPRALAILETELWPELIEAALRRSIPALLLNGRVSDRSMPRYLRLRPLLAPIMAGLACVVPRSETDRDRLVALGCRPEACEEPGDLKGASMPRPWLFPWPQRQRLVLVAGSLHRGEYGLWLDVLQRLRPWPVCHVVAPRHLDRLEDLEGRMREAGVAYDRWSRHRPRFPDPPPQVLLVDTHGDLAGLYAEGDLAFVGGTMDPRRGGHNLYEPAAAGRPVLFGPGVSDHRAAADALLAFGGGVMVNNPAQLVDRLEAWMTHPEAIRAAGQRAYETAVRAYESGKRTLSRAVSLILDAHLGRPG
jgi:3-deoxy-D-manno-octulosonic-acid transferase